MTSPEFGPLRWLAEGVAGWDRFWFTPRKPHVLALLRIFAGCMLLYMHLVWALDLPGFLGEQAWIPAGVSREHAARLQSWAWSPLWYVESLPALWAIHIASGLCYLALAAGWFSRFSAIASFAFLVAYCHRLEGALFGLDQAVAMIALYLCINPGGEFASVDAWRRTGSFFPSSTPETITANLATRLMQLHLCIVYLFGGLSKLRGEGWWDGGAIWGAISNYEYQTLDLTWLAAAPWLLATLTHVTVAWELSYIALVWNRWTRPLVLVMAVLVHAGIALAMGMATFGLAMMAANAIFLEPAAVERLLSRKRDGND
ncbi:MAG TPA: HTTM domain-containing protein [Pirellulaceae bacterium]|jgi:hypothetical protein|nr:HTTM domain-containing protein [Pirellulaceae bacterium]